MMTADRIERYDAILVPGGGLTPEGKIPLHVERRLELAMTLGEKAYIVLLSAGTVYKAPPRDERGFPIFESRAAADYLVGCGIAGERILTETCSYDTIGNAYFSRVVHAEPRGFWRLAVVTSEFHMGRVERVFRWVYGMDEPVEGYSLDFKATKNDGMAADVLAERQRKELDGFKVIEKLEERIQTLASLHKWLFSEHDAYRTGGTPKRLDGKILDTY